MNRHWAGYDRIEYRAAAQVWRAGADDDEHFVYAVTL